MSRHDRMTFPDQQRLIFAFAGKQLEERRSVQT